MTEIARNLQGEPLVIVEVEEGRRPLLTAAMERAERKAEYAARKDDRRRLPVVLVGDLVVMRADDAKRLCGLAVHIRADKESL
jgi:hypothetical protein